MVRRLRIANCVGLRNEKERKRFGWIRKMIVWSSIWIAGMLCMRAEAGNALAGNPYVTFSPDRNAFTTNADETLTKWYEDGYTVDTGVVSGLRQVQSGEHFYTYVNKGYVSVGKWKVEHRPGKCIHDSYPKEDYYYGVPFGRRKCMQKYYSGWRPYCGDCGELVADNLFYMSDEAAGSLKELDMSLAYYYRCPWCTNLEQARELTAHICKAISANQYSVRYHANFGTGYMPKSVHMYGNAVSYEGKAVTPQRTLHLNSYTRAGYEFVGWNTKIDGSGQSFADGAEIYNLCEEEQGSVILFAQWKKSTSRLVIDPNEGVYKGRTGNYEASGNYGSTYLLDPADIRAPKGATVHFETVGGTGVSDITGNMGFAEWSFSMPLHGSVKDNVYYFTGTDGSVDHVEIIYEFLPITLPLPYKEGYSFGGWFYDPAGTKPAGTAGSAFLPTEDITLYAHWVNLQLVSEDNYIANGGKGAVDLSWIQADSRDKTYLIYQKKEDSDWQEIHSAESTLLRNPVKKQINDSGRTVTYTIPYSGYYRLTLNGAQGGSYKGYSGGKGGKVTAVLYLSQGQVLTCKVGGQNGYNGGGNGSRYGNGGGYTEISDLEKGTLLIAGGGGGATSLGPGQDGGSSLCNISGRQGENGAAGGGGGYQGGASGVVTIHTHTAGCRHIHTGTPDAEGGCYTIPKPCGRTSFEKELYKEIFYYGNIDDYGNRVYCVRCGSYECPGHLNQYFQYRCTRCEAVYESRPGSCSAMTRYERSCGNLMYICGYTEGQIVNAQPAYGGSSYVKEQCCVTFEKKQGVNTGNGSIVIESLHLGYQEQNQLKGVIATDDAAPDSIDSASVEISPVEERKVNVSFSKPQDHGTIYYHKVESYNRQTGDLICTSNVTANTLTSGVAGYRYSINTRAVYHVTAGDNWYGTNSLNPYIGVTMSSSRQYLHIAAQDKAGNLSETVHIVISPEDVIFWPVMTDQIRIEEGENVYKHPGEENTYYVKADGTTPFTVSFTGRILGSANKNYQINQLQFLTRNTSGNESEGMMKLMVPMKNPVTAGSHTYQNTDVQKQYENEFCMEDASYTRIQRSDYCKKLQVTQTFKLGPPLHGSRISMVPGAGVMTSEIQVISDRETDRRNGIWLIPDGRGPEIVGLEIPEETLDPHAAKWSYCITVSATDQGSGLKNLWLEIHNTDNGGYEKIEDEDGDGRITLEITSEKSLFLGKYSVIAYARDCVGNETTAVFGLDGIAVDAVIEKIRDPQSKVFKKGESGILKVQAFGYVEKMEVLFPEEWMAADSSINRSFVYEAEEYLQQEEISFMVPLQASEGEVIITVKAYKDDQIVEVDPKLTTITIAGSVLEELRTRLR